MFKLKMSENNKTKYSKIKNGQVGDSLMYCRSQVDHRNGWR